MKENTYDIFLPYRASLKDTSIDKSKKKQGIVEYMTESELEVINFDDVKDAYIRDNALHLSEVPNSNDALYVGENDRACFIEFKNGEIDSVKNLKIKLKIYDSLLILLDSIKKDLNYARENIDYILVYNEEKEHSTKKFNQQEFQKLQKSEVNASNARNAILGMLSEKAGEEYIQFDLKKYRGFLFREVHTYTKWQFERKFVSQISKKVKTVLDNSRPQDL